MNFIIVTQDDILYTPHFFKTFFKQTYFGKCQGVIIQKALGNQTYSGLIRRMYQFYGYRDFLRQGFRFAGRKALSWLYDIGLQGRAVSISNICRKYYIPVLRYESINTAACKQWIEQNDIDLIVSIAASELFDEEILNLPNKGCINFHNAPLPRYRGMLPNFWQMYHDEEYSVLTVHTMTSKLDKGEILLQSKTKIENNYSLEDLIFKTKRKSAEKLVEILQQFKEDEISYTPMPQKEGSYFSFPTADDVSEFKRKGKNLF